MKTNTTKMNRMELNADELDLVNAGATVTPSEEHVSAVAELIKWISSWFD